MRGTGSPEIITSCYRAPLPQSNLGRPTRRCCAWLEKMGVAWRAGADGVAAGDVAAATMLSARGQRCRPGSVEKSMPPKRHEANPNKYLFLSRLYRIINMCLGLMLLTQQIDRD